MQSENAITTKNEHKTNFQFSFVQKLIFMQLFTTYINIIIDV